MSEPVRRSFEVLESDREASAVSICVTVLKELDDAEQVRVATYLALRFGKDKIRSAS